MKVTRKIEVDYAHVLPKHFGFCSKIHGHRGIIEATFSGEIQTEGSSTGMVEDFKILKQMMMDVIHKRLDHAFAVWKDDTEPVIVKYVTVGSDFRKGIFSDPVSECVKISTLDFVKARNGDKILVTDEPPTAEYLAKWCFLELTKCMQDTGLDFVHLENIRFYETPNNWADYTKEDYEKLPKPQPKETELDDTAKYITSFAERHNVPL